MTEEEVLCRGRDADSSTACAPAPRRDTPARYEFVRTGGGLFRQGSTPVRVSPRSCGDLTVATDHGSLSPPPPSIDPKPDHRIPDATSVLQASRLRVPSPADQRGQRRRPGAAHPIHVRKDIA